jgi:hypothetical protein
VIPLISGGDPATGKTPSVAWTPFRKALPTQNDLYHWFVEQHRSAYGVICGRLSSLVVLDLDDATLAEYFYKSCPDLAETYTVRSGIRGTPHLYYQVDFHVSSCKVDGGDLKAEGGYVVGTGSRIGDATWQVMRDCRPKTLTRADLNRLLNAVGKSPLRSKSRAISSAMSDGQSAGELYKREVVRTGERNNTLFNITIQFRDQGWSQAQVVDALAAIHAVQPPLQGQRSESYPARLREADKTIASAFSRPRRVEQRFHVESTLSDTIDNGIREALLQCGGAAFLRAYEGLLLSGMTCGTTFTRKQAGLLLRGVVGDYSIRKALAMRVNGCPLFERATANADPAGGVENKAKTCFVSQQKSTKSRRRQPAHRPAQVYRLPSPDALRRILRLETTVADALEATDITSAKTYRQALQRTFIQRRPGMYSQAWLAKRLGVTPRTIYNYHQALSIHAIEHFNSTRLDWSNYARLLPSVSLAKRMGIQIGSRFLEDDRGKRYPVSLGIAKRLLVRSRHVYLKERTVNEYRFMYHELVVNPPLVQPKAKCADVSESIPVFTPKTADWWTPQVASYSLNVEQSKQIISSPDRPPLHVRKASYTEPLEQPEAERIAQKVYREMQKCEIGSSLSLSNVRCLVDLYGLENVEPTLKRMFALYRKGNITNPAGFMVVASRLKWRAQQSNVLAPAPQFRGEIRRKNR